MRVTPIAATSFYIHNAEQVGWKNNDEPTHLLDALAEFSGRMCYQSWERPNPATATNKGYLDNILNQGHFSVLEHASVSFYVEGVSRSLLTELERHRFLSFSVISQRYVRQDPEGVVTPPAIREHFDSVGSVFDYAADVAFDSYETIAALLTMGGLPRKQALEDARSVLPNATEVKMVVTGNIRAWRDVLGKRHHEAADAEIREFADEVLGWLRLYCPNSVQDIPEEPYS